MADYHKLLVWQKAHAFALEVNTAAANIRNADHPSLRSQLVRAAFSVPTNIVEGRIRQSQSEFLRYLRIALNSAGEVQYHLETARDTGALNQSQWSNLDDKVDEVARMLTGLIDRIEGDKQAEH